jgi:hypothetical protein
LIFYIIVGEIYIKFKSVVQFLGSEFANCSSEEEQEVSKMNSMQLFCCRYCNGFDITVSGQQFVYSKAGLGTFLKQPILVPF